MKQLLAALLTAVLFLNLAVPGAAAGETEMPDTPAVSAASAVVMEADSGRLLWEKEADSPRLIASTTKIMTALVVLERCELEQEVTVQPSWTCIEGSSMYLAAGQVLTVRDLLYGLLLASGNDAAEALACVAAGSAEDFAALMNEKAAALGCENTHFTNPSGLDDEGHYSTARDLALIMRAAIQNADFREIVSTQSKTVGENTYTNHNRLLRECPGVFGGKTGYTVAAGRTLVSCCEREGMTLVCVTLADPDDWRDHEALYDWAYAAYEKRTPLDGASWTVPVIGGTAELVTVTAEQSPSLVCRRDDEVTAEYELPAFVYAAVEAGTQAGQVKLYVNGEKVGRVALLFAGSVDRQASKPPGLRLWVRALLGWAKGAIYTLT